MNTAIVSSASTTSDTSTTASSTLDKDAFLQLLVAQLKNQDPTSAEDPTEMVSQMTSYAQLEQLQNMNTALETLQTQNTGLFQAEAVGLVGKTVRVSSASFPLEDGSAAIGVELEADAASVVLKISDASGKVVATLDEGSQKAGSLSFDWNVLDSSGNALADGTYTVAVAAKDSSGSTVAASTSARVTVESVLFSGGTVLLMAGGTSYSLDAVYDVSA
ncbi:MAG TPA: flagellar hook assembly protein FlgD [Holophaga sp.]|nr:flagellar hook assembly protein FlgD [Holophaga sp.]